MAAKTPKNANDPSTEEKIKEAARIVFHRKGYAATRTRDIAEAAGINLALLNYYFRSKQKLFDIIMRETLQGFMHNIDLVLNDDQTSLDVKIEIFVSRYIDLLIEEPGIPLFIMSEIKNNPEHLLESMKMKEVVLSSQLAIQYQEAVEKGEVVQLSLLHFIMNLVGLTVFPFVGSPIIKKIGDLDDQAYKTVMEERKKLIPIWVRSMMKTQ